ncbi:unnamed protein product [Zymoseptoria tritici ST99CH_1E4]|uniref:Uncharacterized protein n=1 Tax=Zymoseptoria tritici ST99CH_1E4 TaxID=1276532 RepID=A0A2H1G4I4_ZYMTR|nr:unnamed protein product [Zymoseptoria tritici ST99CH_1E4]
MSRKDDYRSPGGIADALVRLYNFESRESDAFITRLAAYPELLLWFVRMFKVVKVQSCAAADGICRGVQKLPKFARAVGGRPQKARCATCEGYTLEDVEMLVQEERVYDWIQEKPTVVNDGDVVVLGWD